MLFLVIEYDSIESMDIKKIVVKVNSIISEIITMIEDALKVSSKSKSDPF